MRRWRPAGGEPWEGIPPAQWSKLSDGQGPPRRREWHVTPRQEQILELVWSGLSDKQIASRLKSVDELVAQIASASKEQSEGISQLNTSVTQMDRVTQSNAVGAVATAQASFELTSQAAAIRQSLVTLRQLAGSEVVLRTQVTPAGISQPRPVPAATPKVIRATPKPGQAMPESPAANREWDSLPLPGDDQFKNF